MTEGSTNAETVEALAHDVAAVEAISAIPAMLRVICKNTGMGFAAVARVTDETWMTCAVHDEVAFGLKVGDRLDLKTTLCYESRNSREAIVIDHFAHDPVYSRHHTARIYNLESYITVPIVLPNGQYFGNLCAIDSKPAHPSDPRVVAMVKAFADVIALQLESEAHRELSTRLAERQVQEAHLREQFIAVLGHDLRSPLAAVSAMAELLSLRKNETDLKIGSRLLAATRRMSALINDVMDFARGRLGSGIDAAIAFDPRLNAALQEVVTEVCAAHAECLITADIVIDEPIFCDTVRVQQLLANLLANAVAHGASGQPVKVIARVDGDAFMLSVHNAGSIIAPETMARVFEPYWRPPTSKPGGGLGLGLFICREIVKSHQGTLTVSSSEEDGTTFAARLPLTPMQQRTAELPCIASM